MTQLTCTDVEPKLDALVDGHLDEAESTALQHHIARCSECRSELARRRDLADALRSLPDSLAPEHDLWPGIRDRIEAERIVSGRFGTPHSPTGRAVWAVAAAAVLAVSVTIAYLIGVERGRPASPDGSGSASDVITVSLDSTDDDLERVTRELRARLEQRRDELSPETWAVITDNLMVIESAIAGIESALDEHPNDQRLNLQLAVAYRRQIDLLRRATTLPADV